MTSYFIYSFYHGVTLFIIIPLLTPNVVTPPSLEPTTSRTPVQRSTTKPKVRTQARGRHYTPPPFLESLVFSSTRHHRLLPNQSPGRASQPHRPLAPGQNEKRKLRSGFKNKICFLYNV